ncbi:serine--tRNA ligase [Oceanidesulfovibrio marinus]|uniref:Serine--tRNA ligase n=1 Tax=Oceanidesulfovibrio marinus TaxID=370038 RepID=A0A6P1ZL60_9BACT|nr:serine--tRNA ligase [Oceanidesulfovibrio marinus]QJT09038.1 serine--tRNA ligase [Oceanidesulfovibrio marinus]TVM36536.1 serine--tRNA ligase [Oceanidesulfovibrio marinus]
MLDLKLVQKDPDRVRAALAARQAPTKELERFLAVDEERRAIQQKNDELKSERNASSQKVAQAKRAGEDAGELIAELSQISTRIKGMDEELKRLEEESREILMGLPNIPHESTPVGASEEDNPVLEYWGEKPELDFEAKDHHDLGVALGGLDFERAARIAGARFAVTWGWASRMERALLNFMVDLHTSRNGYTEVTPPVIVNATALRGTGQLPKFADDLFQLNHKDYYLIPTAEVPVTNLHAGEVLEEADLPRAYASPTQCFRSEAGSYGKDTRGLIRQHQFSKVELVRFVKPEDSYEELEKLRGHAESVLRELNLHYRVITLCTGDIGFSAAKTYDLEVWLPGQNAYREISSCSNFEDFQARRADIRYKPAGQKKSTYVHTLNGSGLAVGRTLVAVMEQYQQADGSIRVPEALQPYMDGLTVIEPKD